MGGNCVFYKPADGIATGRISTAYWRSHGLKCTQATTTSILWSNSNEQGIIIIKINCDVGLQSDRQPERNSLNNVWLKYIIRRTNGIVLSKQRSIDLVKLSAKSKQRDTPPLRCINIPLHFSYNIFKCNKNKWLSRKKNPNPKYAFKLINLWFVATIFAFAEPKKKCTFAYGLHCWWKLYSWQGTYTAHTYHDFKEPFNSDSRSNNNKPHTQFYICLTPTVNLFFNISLKVIRFFIDERLQLNRAQKPMNLTKTSNQK